MKRSRSSRVNAWETLSAADIEQHLALGEARIVEDPVPPPRELLQPASCAVGVTAVASIGEPLRPRISFRHTR